MVSKSKPVFYDLSSALNDEFWSPNTGKIRVLLNYYGIEYELKFVKYQDIEPFLRSKGVLSWAEQGIVEHAPFTLPAMTFLNEDETEAETVMGGDFQLMDKIQQYYGKDVYLGQEEFVKVFARYRRMLSNIIYPICGPFINNILDDDETKEFYIDTRIKKGRGNMYELQHKPRDEFLAVWAKFKDEFSTFANFESFARDEGVDADKAREYRAILDKFLNGGSPFMMGDTISLCDTGIFAVFVWCFQAVKGGAPDYEILDDKVWKTWFDRIAKYNF